jgi:CBS domain-containing protein
VDGSGLGHVRDVVVRVDSETPPIVVGLVVRQEHQDLFVPKTAGEQIAIEPARAQLQRDPGTPAAFARRLGEILLEHDLLDGTVIDLRGPKIVRVNDVLLDVASPVWRVVGVDVGTGALLHRLLPRAFRRTADPQLLCWPELEMLASELPDGILPADHRRLARLHPADIARVAEAVPVRQATEIVGSLDDELAADTMEEMVEERQADIVEQLDPERAADILEHMAPDAAADVLAELEPEDADTMLRRMDPTEAAEAHALLTYSKHTAGGIMTTDYVIAPADLLVGDAAAYLRPQLAKPDWVYYVYVVSDTRERRLLGVFTLRDLLLAEPSQPLADVMTRDVRRVGPETPASMVAKTMSYYNLLALPVTDAQGRLLGIVSVDDALEIVLPVSLRRRLPRVFS